VSLVVLGEAVLRLMSVVGRDSGCLLVVEDLHDCDQETLAVVEFLADNLGEAPAMLLGTVRVEAGTAFDLVRAVEQRGSAAVVTLGRLAEADVTRLVADCLGAAPEAIPRAALDLLWQHSMGVPFMVEELLHGMLSGGSLVNGSRGWQVLGRLGTEVPATLARSVAVRVGRLGPHGRELLGIAALLGRRFPVAAVQRAAGLDDGALLEHVRAAVGAQLVVLDPHDPRFCSFEHPLTAEVLQTQLAPAERADLSRRVARAVRELHPGLPGQWCQQVAVLLLAAGDQGGAAELFAEAGSRAMADGAAQSAVVLLERAERLSAGLGDPVALTPQPLADQVCHAPRIEVGRVTLRRASWGVPPELVPRRSAGETEARYLLRLHGWLAEHGIPERAFVLVNAQVAAGQRWLATAFTKARKPLYVDLASPLQLAVFERMIAAPAQRVMFREALPRLTDANGPDPADPRVTEFVVETTVGAP